MTPPTQPTLSSSLSQARAADIRALLLTEVEATEPVSARRATAPTRVRPARPRLVLACASAVAVAGVAGVLLVADPTAAPANAAWTAEPATAPGVAVDSGDLETWASQCTDLGVGGLSVQGVPGQPEAAARRNVLIDRRGSYTYCVDISSGDQTPANPLMGLAGLTADGGSDDGLSMVNTTSYDKPYDQPQGREILMVGGDLEGYLQDDEDAGTRSLGIYQQWGLVGSDVDGVTIVLANGLQITATVDHGMWGAWWPADRGTPTGSQFIVHSNTGDQTIDPADVGLDW